MSMTVFPGSLDVFNDPTQYTSLAAAGFEHDIEHSKLNDSVAALENKVGINSSTATFTLDYLMHNHTHSGNDGSARLSAIVAEATGHAAGTPPVAQFLSDAGNYLLQVNAVSTLPALQVQSDMAGTPAAQFQQLTGSQTGDVLQIFNANGYAASFTGAGAVQTIGGISLLMGSSTAHPFVSSEAVSGFLNLPNGAQLRGFSDNEVTQTYNLDSTEGILKLGSPPGGGTSLILNAFHSGRAVAMDMFGKDTADSGMTQFRTTVDADGLTYLPRTLTLAGMLYTQASGVLAATEQFEQVAFPTYDGNTTYTKGIGVSVVNGQDPLVYSGVWNLQGNQQVSGSATVGNGLTVTGNSSINGALSLSGALNMNSKQINNLANGVALTDGITLGQANSLYVPAAGSTGVVSAEAFQATGIAPANTASRFAGYMAAGAPTTGTWQTHDWIADGSGRIWICTAGGTPGTWENADHVAAQAQMRGYRNAAWTVPTATTTFILDTKSFDFSNAYNTATGIFTAPVAGRYAVKLQVSASSTAAGQYIVAQVYHNGALHGAGANVYSTTTGQYIFAWVDDVINMAAGDQASFNVYTPTAGLAGNTGTQSVGSICCIGTP